MSRYRRAKIEGGVFFFTVTLADRSSDLLVRHIDRLRRVYKSAQERHPFQTIAICVLPDHLHAIWSLPPNDADFPLRWSVIKSRFSRELATSAERSLSKIAKRDKGIWQRRYWEHAIRDDADLARHVDYIHFNPVKHGYVSRVGDWPHSSFVRYVARGILPPTGVAISGNQPATLESDREQSAWATAKTPLPTPQVVASGRVIGLDRAQIPFRRRKLSINGKVET